jgi:hypothetical protein
MEQESGTTGNEITTRYIHISDIYEETFDEETKHYIFEFFTFAGEYISLRLKKKDIQRFNLFMNKSDAEQRWLDHIMNR